MPKTVQVDKNNLEGEWTDQPGAMHYVLIQWAEKLQERKEAEKALELVMAEMDERIRTAIDKAGEKATETAVKRKILGTKAYQQAAKYCDQCAHELHLIEAERSGLEHKKAALDNLTRLRLADWYSEPKRPRSRDYDAGADEQRDALQPKAKKHAVKKQRPERV